MKRKLHIIKPVLIMLLVLCTVLTSCITDDAPLTDTDNNTHEHSTTGTPETDEPSTGDDTTGGDNGENNGDVSTPCTHATTTLVGATEATCAKEGYTGDVVCNACTEIVTKGTSIAKTQHEWNNGETTKNPTCISTGVKTITCTACGDTKTETLSTVPHNDLYHDRLDGTHSHTCSTCTLNENKVHTPVEGSMVRYEPTCLEPAYFEFTCVDCHGVYKVYSSLEEDKAKGHSFGEWAVLSDSTCKETGMKTRSCECGVHEELVIEMDANKHQWTENTRTAATCNQAGSVDYVCTVCHEHNEQVLTATGVHKYETLESGNDGWTTQECRHCHNQIKSFDASKVVIAEVKAEALPENQDFGVTTEKATIEFPKEVVSQLKDGGSTDIAIGADVVKDKENLLANASKLSEEQKERLSDVDIFDFSVTVNDQKLEDNFEKPVTVTMPYTLKEGESPDGIVIWYVADDGEIEEISAVYDAETKTVSFSAAHFSFYAVAYKETQEMQCRRGHHNYQPTSEVVAPTCESFGYTVCKCACGAKMLDQIVEKLGHDYGNNVIKAQVTCEEGGWDYQECSKCHHKLNVKYVAALGHTPDKVATCTEASTCTTCHQVVKPALGHAWTDWSVVLEPTEVNSGLRRRYCLTCGEKEEVRLAATGNIQAITFESYEEMFGAILSETLNLGNGIVNVSYIMNGVTYTFDMKVNEANGEYTILVDLIMSAMIDGQLASQTYTVLYRNGVIAYVHETGEGKIVDNIDLETIIGAPFEIFWDYLEQTFNLIDPSVAMALEEVKALLDEYGALYGADINKILADAGAKYTYEELYSLLDSFETVYAYVALKLGYQSSLVMHEGVEIPTKNDFVAVISAFMTKTESNGRVDYKWNVEPLLDAANAVVDWFTEKSEKPISELFYELFGADIVASNPSLTDWNACVTYVRENLPGTTTLKDAVDWMITVIEKYDFCTVEDVYALIDAYAFEMSGEQFNTAEFVAQYGEQMTLDMFAEEMMGKEGATLDEVYTLINDMLCKTQFGSLTLMIGGEEISIAQLAEMASAYLSMFDVTLDYSFAVDEKGNLLEINLDHKLSMIGEGENGENVTCEIESLTLLVKVDDSVKIDVPAIIQPVLNNRVTASYDQNGNLIIKGLDGSFTYEFFIAGGDRFDLSELMERDDTMSTQLGCDVYVTDKTFWTQSQSIDTGYIFKINGKYYKAEYKSVSGYYKLSVAVAWDELIADPSVLMPREDEWSCGYYMDYPVYETEFGYAYLGNEGWMLINEYDYHWEWIYDEKTDKEINIRIFNVYRVTSLKETFANAYIGSIDQINQKIKVDGEEIYLSSMTIQLNENRSIEMYCYLEGDTIVVAQTQWVEGTGYYVLGDELTELPEHDRINEWTNTLTYVDKDGNEVTEQVTRINLFKKLPTYYVKVTDGTYVSINNLSTDAVVDGLKQITLPDGNVMYVLGTQIQMNGDMGGKDYKPNDGNFVVQNGVSVDGGFVMNGTVSGVLPENVRVLTYGYVKIADGLYVQARCYVRGDVIEAFEYRDTTGDVYKNFNDVYDLNEYMTKNADGSYTVSAELLNKLKAQCTDEGDMFAINLRGSKTEANVTYTVSATVGTYMVPVTLQLGGMHGNESESKYYDWDELFNGNGSDGELYQTQVNPDGSVTLFFRNGAKLEVDCYVGDEVLADDYLIPNEQESQKTGLNIYDCIEKHESNYSYVYQDGKYYTYSWGNSYNMTVVDSLEKLLASGWIISEMTYRFDVKLDENSDELTRVYEAHVKLQRDTGWMFYNNSLTVYFMVIDGELYALKQAVNLGDSQLRFEEYVKASEYFASLAVESTVEPQKYTTVYINGVATDIYSEYINIYETDANGNPLVDLTGDGKHIARSTTVYYMLVDGQKQYMTVMERSNGSYMVLGEEVAVDLSEYEKVNHSDSECENGTFQVVNLIKVHDKTTHFVMLAGKCYRLDSYYWNRIQEDAFKDIFCEDFYCYRVWDESAKAYKYYAECNFESDASGKEVAVLSKEIDITAFGDLFVKDIGKTADGLTVEAATVRYLNPEEVVITELDDGTVLYARPKYGDCFLKVQDGYYVRAYFVTNSESGEQSIVCELDRAYVSGEILEDMGALDRYITVEGNKVTISSDIFDLINDNNRYDFQIKIFVDNKGCVTLDYFQLLQIFNMNDNNDGKEDFTPDDGKEDYPTIDKEEGKEDYPTTDKEEGKEDYPTTDKEDVKEEITESEEKK